VRSEWLGVNAERNRTVCPVAAVWILVETRLMQPCGIDAREVTVEAPSSIIDERRERGYTASPG